jgi:hypothetical protein
MCVLNLSIDMKKDAISGSHQILKQGQYPFEPNYDLCNHKERAAACPLAAF